MASSAQQSIASWRPDGHAAGLDAHVAAAAVAGLEHGRDGVVGVDGHVRAEPQRDVAPVLVRVDGDQLAGGVASQQHAEHPHEAEAGDRDDVAQANRDVEQRGEGHVGVVAEHPDLGRIELRDPEHQLGVGGVDRVVVLMRVAAEDELALGGARFAPGVDHPPDALVAVLHRQVPAPLAGRGGHRLARPAPGRGRAPSRCRC